MSNYTPSVTSGSDEESDFPEDIEAQLDMFWDDIEGMENTPDVQLRTAARFLNILEAIRVRTADTMLESMVTLTSQHQWTPGMFAEALQIDKADLDQLMGAYGDHLAFIATEFRNADGTQSEAGLDNVLNRIYRREEREDRYSFDAYETTPKETPEA